MALQLRRAKPYWSGCCQMAVQEDLWLAKTLYLNVNFNFLIQISVLLNQVATQLPSRRTPWLGRSIVHTSLWRMDHMKATLWCHAYVSRSVPPQPVVPQDSFWALGEDWGEGWHETNEWEHEEWRTLVGWNWRYRRTPRRVPNIPTLPTTIVPLGI